MKSVRQALEDIDNAVMRSESAEEFMEAAGSWKVLDEAKTTINEASELAKQTILARMSEEDFVTVVNRIESVVASAIAADSCPAIGFLALSRDLRPFTHTITLTVIGFLIEEGVL